METINLNLKRLFGILVRVSGLAQTEEEFTLYKLLFVPLPSCLLTKWSWVLGKANAGGIRHTVFVSVRGKRNLDVVRIQRALLLAFQSIDLFHAH